MKIAAHVAVETDKLETSNFPRISKEFEANFLQKMSEKKEIKKIHEQKLF